VLAAVSAAAATGTDLSGRIFLTTGSTDSGGGETDLLEQHYSLRLSQVVTPFLDISLSWGLQDFESQASGAGPLTNRTDFTTLNLSYSRKTVSADLSLPTSRP
jgi:hypothetical protein